jgi:M6 family metalloprotease-like protein
MKKQLLLILLMFLISHAFAAYLKNVPVEFMQPDGTIIHCFVTGDEFHRRVHDKNNYSIVQDPASGYYVFANLADNQLVPTPHIVGQTSPAETSLQPGYDVLPAEMEAKRYSSLKSASVVAANPTTGDFNNIVIPIRFADQEPSTFSADNLYWVLNSMNDLSLRYYFREVSNNRLDVISRIFPEPEKDRLFEHRDSYPRHYYTKYNAITNPDGYQGSEGIRRLHVLLKKALESVAGEVEATGIDFDMNDDGIIDNILFVIQGDADAWGDVLWPNKSSLINENVRIGGNRAGTYNLNLSGSLSAGVLCHEFFHSLGAPDLYRYTNQEIQPVGAWDIMGAMTTQHPTTYMKWRYGKWIDDIPELTSPGTYTLEPVSQNPFACYKIPSPEGSGEYFMLEYRNREGLLESSLPLDYEEGLIIYRINPDVLHDNGGGPPDEVFVFRPDGDEFDTGKINLASFSANSSRTVLIMKPIHRVYSAMANRDGSIFRMFPSPGAKSVSNTTK